MILKIMSVIKIVHCRLNAENRVKFSRVSKCF